MGMAQQETIKPGQRYSKFSGILIKGTGLSGIHEDAKMITFNQNGKTMLKAQSAFRIFMVFNQCC
jgi:hypothetical protein